MTDGQKIEPRPVTLEVWRSSENLPTLDKATQRSKEVFMWNESGCCVIAFLNNDDYLDEGDEDNEDLWWVFGKYEDAIRLTNTSWAYIPDIKEAT